MSEQETKSKEVVEEKPKGFRRVAIAESDSEEEDTENKAQNAQDKPTEQKQTTSSSSAPIIEEVSSTEQNNWWQKKESNYADYENKPKADASPEDIKKQLQALEAKKKELEANANAQ